MMITLLLILLQSSSMVFGQVNNAPNQEFRVNGQNGQNNGDKRAIWQFNDEMNNWTELQWDGFWSKLESAFGDPDEDGPEWNSNRGRAKNNDFGQGGANLGDAIGGRGNDYYGEGGNYLKGANGGRGNDYYGQGGTYLDGANGGRGYKNKYQRDRAPVYGTYEGRYNNNYNGRTYRTGATGGRLRGYRNNGFP
jgi:hypothetical protein